MCDNLNPPTNQNYTRRVVERHKYTIWFNLNMSV